MESIKELEDFIKRNEGHCTSCNNFCTEDKAKIEALKEVLKLIDEMLKFANNAAIEMREKRATTYTLEELKAIIEG